MEFRKMIFDGVEYNILTDKELKEYTNEQIAKSHVKDIMDEVEKNDMAIYTLEEFERHFDKIYE